MSQNFKVKNGLDVNGVQIIAANGQLTGPAATQITNIISSSSDTWVRNAANAASSYANSAYSQANTATTNAATADQKAVSAGSYANSAYGQANTGTTNAATADQRAVTSGSYANSAYTQANTATTNAATADQRAVTSGSFANSAFDAANTADQRAVTSGDYANSAYTAANTADQRAVTSGSFANGAFAAANTKLSSSGGTISGNLVVSGNLTITGNVTTVSANNLIINDNMIYLNDGDYSSNIDLGIAGNYNDGSYKHTGLFRDASDGIWKFYDGYLPEPDAAVDIDTSNSSFRIATVQANLKSDVVFIRGYDPINHTNTAYTHANSSYTTANNLITSGLVTYNHAIAAFGTANTAVSSGLATYNHAVAAFGTANNAYTSAGIAVTGNGISFGHANAAFNTANSSISAGLATYNHAAAAFNKANTAGITITNVSSGSSLYPVMATTTGSTSTLYTDQSVLRVNPIAYGSGAGGSVDVLGYLSVSNVTTLQATTNIYGNTHIGAEEIPGYLDVDNGSGTKTIILDGSTGTLTASNTTLNSLGVGTAASGTTGEIRATNNITGYYSSDKKLKENIQDVTNALNIVCAIGSKTFDWTDAYLEAHGGEDGYFLRKSDFGVIAQDVQSVFPQAVRTREDGTLAVDYEKLAVLSFGAIKELVKRIEVLESK
jgi:hypothetical protein